MNISKVGRTRITSWSWVSEKAGRIGSLNKEERKIDFDGGSVQVMTKFSVAVGVHN